MTAEPGKRVVESEGNASAVIELASVFCGEYEKCSPVEEGCGEESGIDEPSTWMACAEVSALMVWPAKVARLP